MASPDDKREVFSHSYNINKSIDAILQSIRKLSNVTEIENEVVSVKQQIAGFGNYLSKTIEPQYYAERRHLDSTIATMAFGIPELFESIVANLDIVSLMGCYNTILFLRADPESEVLACRLPRSDSPFHFIGRVSHDEPFRVYGSVGNWHVMIDTRLPLIGSRWKRMFVAQPPIHNATFWVICEPDKSPSHCVAQGTRQIRSEYFVFQSERGVTVGDVYDKAVELLEAHRNSSKGSLSISYGGDDARGRPL